MGIDRRSVLSVAPMPDVYYVELHHHPLEWSNGSSPEVYKFKCIGRAWGPNRWVIHAIWADRPAPMRLRTTGMLKGLISTCLAEQLGREIPQFDNDLLAWKDA